MRSKMNDFHYQLAQAGGLSIDFVAFGRIRCCRWPHRNRPKARGGRALATQYVNDSSFRRRKFNRGAITAISVE
jgi:hypothetical protein